MASLTTLLVIGFLATASAAPGPSDLPRCAHECPPAGSQKLFYAPDKTYSYAYSGKSEIHMKDVEGGISQMEWNSQVDLTWISPCDMAITFRNPSFGGASGIPEANFLARYPLVVAVTDGRVQHVCSHPDDDTWAINLKKGVASAFQNTLPSNSSINSGLNFTETDVAGKCPTTYEVQNEEDKVIVEKVKNHRFCQERFPSQAETPMSWIKAPLPFEESWSKCKQEISQGIYKSIVCEDKNIIKPAIGSYKYVEAKQTSKLQYQSESSNVPQAVASLRGQLYKRSLRFDHETLKKNPAKVPELEQTLKQVCEKTKQRVEKEAAILLDKAIHLMRRIPESAIEQLLQKVKNGEICSDRQKMESLFLDAVAFVQEANTVKLMVREILSGRTSGGRAALYTVALYFTPRPSLRAVEAVKPLLEQSQRFPMASLAAATMVNTYCRHHPHCQQEAPVRQAAEALSRSAQQQCSSTESLDAERACLAALKSLGNMGVMSSEIARNVISIIEKEEVQTAYRVAAAQAFRNAPCVREATRQLVTTAVNPSKETETRIASYLAAAKCAEEEDFREIADKIAKEDNTQVRGFILSHLLNLRESSAPHKERLRYILSSLSIPSNFSADARKYSRNIDFSYYAPSFGVGAGVESNIIYTPRSFIPRSVNFNISSAMGATQVNLGEFGARIEGVQPALEKLFGPEGYFQKSSMDKVISDLSQYVLNKEDNILKHIQGFLRERRSIDLSAISHFFDKIYGERSMKQPRADLFARINGQEIAYAPLTKRLLEGINTDTLIDKFFDLLQDAASKAAHMNVNTARAFQTAVDYSLPTIQGVPLKLKMNATAVLGLKLETQINSLESSSPSIAKIKPSLSSELAGFIGFDTFLASCGVRTQTSISSKNDVSLNIKGGRRFEIELDIPEKMEVIDAQHQTYLMKAVRGQPESKIIPSGVRTIPAQSQGCFHKLQQVTGLKVCYDINLPNIRSEGLPLSQQIFAKLTAEKAESSMKGWKAMGEVVNTDTMRQIKLQMETEGSSTPRKAEGLLKYSVEGDSVAMVAAVSSQTSGGFKAEVNTKNSESEKMFQFDAYKSNNQHFTPETQVLEVQFSTRYNGQASQVRILANTKNALRRLIEHDFEVQGDIGYARLAGLPYPQRLDKFKFKTAAGQYRVESSVEKKSESEYSSLFRAGSKTTDKYAVTASHTVEGSAEEGYSLKTVAKAMAHGTQYKAAFDIHNNREKLGTTLYVIKPQDSSQLVQFETLFSRSGSSYNAKFQLAAPRYMNPVRFESKVDDQGSHRYHLQMVLKHGSKLLLQADGPVTAKFTSAIKQVQADLSGSTSESMHLRVSTALILAKNQQLVSCQVEDQKREQLFDLKWSLSPESEETKTEFRLLLPYIIDNKISAIISRKNLQVSFNNLVSPKSPSSRRWKGYADADFERKNAKAELSWNADKDPSQKLSFEGTVVSSPASHQQTTIHGSWTFIGSTYQYKSDVSSSNPETWIWGQKNVQIKVTSPQQKTYILHTNMDTQRQSSGASVKAQVQYTNPESMVYKVDCDASVEQLGRPYNFKVTADTLLAIPEAGQSSINFEAKYEHMSSQREAYIEIQVSNPKLSKPVQTDFRLKHQPSSYSAHWSVNVESPKNAAVYDVKLSPEGGVQFCKVEFDAQEIANLANAAGKLAGMESGSASSSRGGKYLIQYEKPSHASHKLSVHSPSRKMEAEVKYSPTEYSVKFHPNKEMSESKYAASWTRSGSSGHWEELIKYKGHFEHPSSERPKELEIAYSRSEGKIQGSATLDIFSRAEDKISASLESAILAKNSLRVEAKLSGKALKSNPRVIVTGSYASHTVAFDVLLENAPRERPSLVISGKYDRSAGRNAAIALTVKNEERPVLEISGSVRAENEPECNGLKIAAAARSSAIGTYDISSKLCTPGFAKMFVKNQNSNVGYTARAGLQTGKILEFSVSENHMRQQEERHIAMARVVLTSPKIVNAEGKWESERASNLWEAASEKMSTVSSLVKSWAESMEREYLQQSGSGSPVNEVQRLFQETKEEFQRIYNDLVNDNLIPSWDNLERKGVNQFVRKAVNSYKQIWYQVDELKKKIYQTVPNTVRSLKDQFQGLTRAVNTAVVGSARWMKTGEMPEEISDIVEQITNSQLWDDVKTFANDVKNFLVAEETATSEVIQKYKKVLIKDLEKIREDLMMNYKVQQNVNWIIENLNFERLVAQGVERVFNKIVQSSLLTSAQIRGNHVQIQMPLQQPASSLGEAWKYLMVNPIPVPDNALRMYESITLRPVDSLVWYYYNLLPQRVTDLLPPYNPTAILVDGSEILTFDGTLLRAPRSPCKVLLAAYKSTSLIMEHPRSLMPQVTLKAGGVNVVMKPDGKVMVNGREVSAPEQTEGEVTIYKNQEEIKVMSPHMTVRVYPRNNVVSVEVTGWAFGHVAGLLGTYDGERANDWATLQGSHASSLQELVRSWQEDPHCQTPSIAFKSPSEIPPLRSLQCQALLGIRSRCNAVVRPEAFIKMCYSSKNPCDVAKAYRDVCSSKGLKAVFPLTC